MEFASLHITEDTDKPVYIFPVSDIQWTGSKETIAYNQLTKYIDRGVNLNAYYIYLGDGIDFMSPSNRQRLQAAALYDTSQSAIDSLAVSLVTSLYDQILKPTTGRFLCGVHGHHYTLLSTGENTDQVLFRMLGAQYLGSSGFLRVFFTQGHHQGSVYIYMHHGRGSGKAHAPIMKLENIAAYWSADVFVMGHSTRNAIAKIARMEPLYVGKSARLVERTIHFVGCGGWSRSYIEHSKIGNRPHGTYAEEAMYPPSSVGSPIIKIVPNWAKGSWKPTITVEL
jgi:hypothetical protein